MYSKSGIKTSTEGCLRRIERLQEALEQADAVVIGAGAGLSASAGFTYSGERFEKYFGDFIAKYGFGDMYSGGFHEDAPFGWPEGRRPPSGASVYASGGKISPVSGSTASALTASAS